MVDNLIFVLGENKDSSISLRILPLWKCKVLFELNPRVKLSVNYYLNEQKEPAHTYIIAEANPNMQKIGFEMWNMWATSSYTANRLNPLIQAMENNKSHYTALY